MPTNGLLHNIYKSRMILAVGMLAVLPAACARADSYQNLSPATAIANFTALPNTGKPVAMYFSSDSHPAVLHDFGTFTTNRRANAVFHSNDAACSRAIESGLISLRSRAQSLGANGVINIQSDLAGVTATDTSMQTCRVGLVAVQIQLKGDVVQLAP